MHVYWVFFSYYTCSMHAEWDSLLMGTLFEGLKFKLCKIYEKIVWITQFTMQRDSNLNFLSDDSDLDLYLVIA